MFFWWELCKLLPQHYLIDSSSRASCNPHKQIAIAFALFSISYEEQFANRNSYCGLWWLTNIIIVPRRLRKGRKTLPWGRLVQTRLKSQKLDYHLKRYPILWILWTNSFNVGKAGWKKWIVSTPDVFEFVEYSRLTKPSSSGKHSFGTEYVQPPILHRVQQLVRMISQTPIFIMLIGILKC